MLTITAQHINKVTITNLPGQVLYSHQFDAEQVVTDVSMLQRGLYLLRVNDGQVTKFVKK